MQVAKEIEVKFFPIDIDNIRTKLKDNGATIKTPERTMRRMVFGGEDNPGMDCTYGRVRDEGNVITMSAKYSSKGTIESQREAVIEVNDFDEATKVLQCFGLKPSDYQENKRETWQWSDGTSIELETWPELPNYMEIEGQSVEAIHAVADALDLDWSEHLTCPTNELYAQHFNLSKAEVHEKMKDLRF